MKTGIFSIDNPIFHAISRIGDMFILSFIWLLTSLPLFTLGASSTALMGTVFKILRKRDTNVVKDYFRLFKENFVQSTLIFIPMAVVGAILAADLYYWFTVGGTQALIFGGISIAVALPYLSTLLFVFPVQAIFDNKIKDTVRTAFLISFRHWPTSLALILLVGGLAYICDLYIIVAFFALIFGTGLLSFILGTRFIAIFSKYNSEIAGDIAKEMETINEPTIKIPHGEKFGKSKVIR